MLKSLHIKNFAVIKDLKLDLGEGLNIFTGETGAGKSILIEALGFVLGARASSEYLRPGSFRLEVEAVFSSSLLPEASRREYAIRDPLFTLKREMDSRGRGRAFIDSKPVPIAALAFLGNELVDFHGQHEHQSLIKPAMHLELLDRFSGLEGEVEKVKEAFDERRSISSKLESMKLSREEKSKLEDLYGFQLKEIEDAAIKPGEDAEIDNELPRMKNSEKLRSLAESAYGLLYSQDGSAQEKLGTAARFIDDLGGLDSSASGISELIKQASITLEEVSDRLSSYKESVSSDPLRIEAYLSRQDLLARLKKKYGPELKDVLAKAEHLKAKLSDLECSDEREQDLKEALERINKKLASLSNGLHDKRMSSAKKLAGLVLREIRPLGFPNVKFSVSVEMEEGRFNRAGSDEVEFLFSPNPGQPLKSLGSIASAGEMSRVMLGLKAVLASADRVPILVFDEVDTGVGAVIGRLVGERLSALSSKKRAKHAKQALCITHLAQVAAFGSAHFHIRKESRDNSTFVASRRLEGGSRTQEIARMLGGKRESSRLSIKHAEELLAECRKMGNVV